MVFYLAAPLVFHFETNDFRYERAWPLGLVFVVPLLLVFVSQACVLMATRLEAVTIEDGKLRYGHVFGFSVALDDIVSVQAEKDTAPSYFPAGQRISLRTRGNNVKVIATALFRDDEPDLVQSLRTALGSRGGSALT
jgi:hypothetical protein